MYTDTNSLVDISFDLHWTDSDISHNHSYFAGEVNLWRDFFPQRLYQSIINKPEGYKTEFILNAGELIPDYTKKMFILLKTITLILFPFLDLQRRFRKDVFIQGVF